MVERKQKLVMLKVLMGKKMDTILTLLPQLMAQMMMMVMDLQQPLMDQTWEPPQQNMLDMILMLHTVDDIQMNYAATEFIFQSWFMAWAKVNEDKVIISQVSESWIFFDLSTDQKLCTLFYF